MMMVVILLMKMDYQAKSLSVNKIGLDITKQKHCLVSMYEQVEKVMMTMRLLRIMIACQSKALNMYVTKEINAVCDFILEASEQAKALATLPKEERGPLYGLPLSVKVTHMSLGIYLTHMTIHITDVYILYTIHISLVM